MTDTPVRSTMSTVRTWLENVAGLIGAIAGLIGAILPGIGQSQRVVAYVVCLVLIALFVLFKYLGRQSKPQKLPADAPIGATAVLRGLLPFEAGDRLIGRDRDVQNIVTIVRSQGFRFGVVWGPSGCGKTSLLRAGVLPALARHKIVTIDLAQPTAVPHEVLEARLTTASGGRAAGDALRTIIVIDQFEEFFLLNRDKDSIYPFKDWLSEKIAQPEAGIGVLVGIREDFFARLQHLAAPEVPDPTSTLYSYELKNLSTAEAREVLAQSVTQDGASFAPDLIEEVLVDLDSDGFVRPTELQLVATHLKRRGVGTVRQFEALERCQGILGSYIKDELRRSGDPLLSGLVLRMMCSEGFQAKAPSSVSLDDLVDAVDGRSEPAKADQVRRILGQLVDSRIVAKTGDQLYNLVHDYFASLVATATRGMTTKKDLANRMLSRYSAHFRENLGVRIPLADLLFIRKHAEAAGLRTEGVQALLSVSWRSIVFWSLGVVGLLALPVLGTYVLLMNSYYLSTSSSPHREEAFSSILDRCGTSSPSAIVVRAGLSSLKALPGFDEVLVATDFSMSDVAPEDMDARDAFPRETLWGVGFAGPHGHDTWIDRIHGGLNPMVRAESYRLLGRKQEARDVLLSEFSEPSSKEHAKFLAALALGDLARTEPEAVSAEFLAPLIALLSDATGKPPSARTYMIFALTEMSAHGVAVPEIQKLSVVDLLREVPVALDEREDFFSRPRSSIYVDAVTNILQSSPDEISDEEIDALLSILKDENVDTFFRRDLLAAAATVGGVNLQAGQRVFKGLLAQRYETGWFEVDAMKVALDLAARDERLVDDETLRRLAERVLGDPTHTLAADIYSYFAPFNAAAVDVGVLNALVERWEADPKPSNPVLLPLFRLSRLTPEWDSPVHEKDVWSLLDSRPERTAAFSRREAVIALLEVLEAKPDDQNLRSLLASSLGIWNEDGIGSHELGVSDLMHVITRAARLRPGHVDNDLVLKLLDTFREPAWSGNEFVLAKALLAPAKQSPPVLQSLEALEAAAKVEGPVKKGLFDYYCLAVARAQYERGLQKPDGFFELLEVDADPKSRLIGAYGIFLVALEHDEQRARLDERLRELRTDSRPHVRAAASRAAELLALVRLVRDVKNDERVRNLRRSRLNALQVRSGFMGPAAILALEKLEVWPPGSG